MIGRRHRPRRVRREPGRLGHVLLADLADLQLQLLLVLEDVTVGELEVVGGLGRREHAVLLEQLHHQVAPVLENLPVALLLGRVDRPGRRRFGRPRGPVRTVGGHFFVLFHVKVRPEEPVADDVRAGRSGRRGQRRTAVRGERGRWERGIVLLLLLLLLLMLVLLLGLLLMLMLLLLMLLVVMIFLDRCFKLLLLLLLMLVVLLLLLRLLLLLLLLAIVLGKDPRRRWH